MILGTFHYMAPEQLEGREADHRTDILAFGVALHEMDCPGPPAICETDIVSRIREERERQSCARACPSASENPMVRRSNKAARAQFEHVTEDHGHRVSPDPVSLPLQETVGTEKPGRRRRRLSRPDILAHLNSLLSPRRASIDVRRVHCLVDRPKQAPVVFITRPSNVRCIEYDVTADEALQIVIQYHRASEDLNDFCRIVMALELEPCFRERSRRARPTTGAKKPSSNLTNDEHRDVRKAIARVAAVSTGNVTKVKQLLTTVIQETRARLLWGEVSIHRAWQWRTLTAKAQRDALWEHLHRGAIKTTIARLVRAHAEAGAPVRPPDVATIVLGGLATFDAADITVGVVDVPGRAVVVTQACYDELQEKSTR